MKTGFPFPVTILSVFWLCTEAQSDVDLIVSNSSDYTVSNSLIMNEHEICLDTSVQNTIIGSENVALGKPTAQSSIGWSGLASRAVDGNTSGNWNSNSISHTQNSGPQYWEVDLLNRYFIKRLNLYSRIDCCTARNKNIVVTILDDDEEVWRYDQGGVTPSHLTVLHVRHGDQAYVMGNKVKVSLLSEYLSIAELEVLATPNALVHLSECQPDSLKQQFESTSTGQLKNKDGSCLGTSEGNKNNMENVALGKPTVQSSEGWGGKASRAVDGNNSGNYWHHSITHTLNSGPQFWEVDLLDKYRIGRLNLYSRTDCCTNRNANIVVTILDDGKEVWRYDQGGVTPSHLSALDVKDGDHAYVTGNKVKVSVLSEYLSIAELEVMAITNRQNVALGKPTVQSSEGWGGKASRAVDGNNSGNWGSNTISHTLNSGPQFWEVDLLDRYRIGKLNLYSRTDCCTSRNANIVVTILDDGKEVWSYDQGGVTPSHLTTLDVRDGDNAYVTGNKVKVSVLSEYLSIAELEVMAMEGSLVHISECKLDNLNQQWEKTMSGQIKNKDGSCLDGSKSNSLENVALGKPTAQSSEGWGGKASRAVDGNANGNYWYHSISHTLNSGPQYWEVDLLDTYRIEKLNLYSRMDCCTSRNANIVVTILNDGKEVWSYDQGGVTPSHLTTLDVENGDEAYVMGDKVKVSLLSEYLSIAELEVLATVDVLVHMQPCDIDNNNQKWAIHCNNTFVMTVDTGVTDESAGETSYELTSSDGTVIFSDDIASQATVKVACLDEGVKYTYKITKEGGLNGFYKLILNDKVLNEGGEFEDFEGVVFKV